MTAIHDGKRKILLSANTAWFIYHFEGALVKELLAQGHEVHCAVPQDAQYYGELVHMGCICHSIYISRKGMNPLVELYTLATYLHILMRVRPRAMYNFTVKPVIYGSLATRVLRVPTINTITGLGSALLGGGLRAQIVQRLYRLSQKSVQAIFVLNENDYAFFKDNALCAEPLLTIVPGAGVNTERFSYSEPREHETFTFLFLGRLLKDKGVVEFLQAAAQVATMHHNTRFLLLGPKDPGNLSALSKAELERYTKKPQIHYVGVKENVLPQIQQADCVVLPSYTEGMPTALLEALAVGRPIITTDAPGCRDVVEDTVNGLMVPKQDAKALERAMVTMCTLTHSERVAMSKAGRKKVLQEFDEQFVLQKYLTALKNLL